MRPLRTRLLHYPMNNSLFTGERTALLAATQGSVLEICIDSDKNVSYYSPWVTDLAMVYLEGPAAPSRHDVADHGLHIERIFPGSDTTTLPFPEGRFDWAVSTLTLCRTRHTERILAEVRRVLKPSGAYLFIEHGRASDAAMAQRQQRLRNLWLKYGGCDVAREIESMIRAPGFRLEKLERYQLGHPKFLSTMVRGLARPN